MSWRKGSRFASPASPFLRVPFTVFAPTPTALSTSPRRFCTVPAGWPLVLSGPSPCQFPARLLDPPCRSPYHTCTRMDQRKLQRWSNAVVAHGACSLSVVPDFLALDSDGSSGIRCLTNLRPSSTTPHAVGTARQSSSAFYPMRNNIKTPGLSGSLPPSSSSSSSSSASLPFNRGVCLVVPLFHRREPIRRPWGVARSLTWSN